MNKYKDGVYTFLARLTGVLLVGSWVMIVMGANPLILRADDSTSTPTPGTGQGVQKTTDEIMKAQQEKDLQNQTQAAFTPREALKPGRRSNGTPLPQNPESSQTSSTGAEPRNAELFQQFVIVLVIGVFVTMSMIFQHR